MHPYEWGILGVKRLDFYPISNCADCTNIAPAVVETLVAIQASIAATFPSHLGSDRQGALLLTSYRGQTFNRLSSPIALLALLLTSHRGQTFNRPSTAIASVAIIYTNKLN
jgi:hypothetical protein